MAATNKEIIAKVNAAFSENKPEVFLEYCSDNVRWDMAGDQVRTGKESIREFMSQMEGAPPPNFTVDAIVSEGDRAVCFGNMTMQEDGGASEYSYCDAYQFADGKIVELRSYVVKQKSESDRENAASA